MNYPIDTSKLNTLMPFTVVSVTEGDPGKVADGTARTPNEKFPALTYYQHVGFSSLPKADAVGVLIHKNCNYYLIATADAQASRPALSDPGDVCIYTDKDNYIKIAADGSIEIKTAGKAVSINNGAGSIMLKANGDVEIGSTPVKLATQAGQTQVGVILNQIAAYINGIVPGTVTPWVELPTYITQTTKVT